jgi:hypothetical protein
VRVAIEARVAPLYPPTLLVLFNLRYSFQSFRTVALRRQCTCARGLARATCRTWQAVSQWPMATPPTGVSVRMVDKVKKRRAVTEHKDTATEYTCRRASYGSHNEVYGVYVCRHMQGERTPSGGFELITWGCKWLPLRPSHFTLRRGPQTILCSRDTHSDSFQGNGFPRLQ